MDRADTLAGRRARGLQPRGAGGARRWRERSLVLIGAYGVREILSLRGTFVALAAVGERAVVVLRRQGRANAVAYAIDLRARLVIAERTLEGSDIAVTADPTTGRIALTDRDHHCVVLLDSSLMPVRETRSSESPYSRPTAPHPHGCCCPCCPPPYDDPARPPSEGGAPPGDRPPGTTTGERDPARPDDKDDGRDGHPGQAGVPSGVGVGDGGRVGHHPPPGRGSLPCGFGLLWTPVRLLRAGPFIAVLDGEKRHLAVLSLPSFDVVSEWSFGRMEASAMRIATDPQAPVALDSPWGSGKTTLVRMLAAKLNSESFQCVYFQCLAGRLRH